MSQFPSNVRELAKEIAAFSTSGGGQILLGVDNAGGLVGLDCGDSEKRDDYLNRIQGIASGTVKPSVTPRVGFACEAGHTVVFVRVHKGDQPVYYCAGKPYVRHLTESRPATPEEVVRRVLDWRGIPLSEESEQAGYETEYHWKPELDSILVELLIAIHEMPELRHNPGLDYLQSACELCASRMRELIIDYLEDEDAVAATLRSLAEKCDGVVEQLGAKYIGMWPALVEMCEPIGQTVEEIRKGMLGGPPVDDDFAQEAKGSIKTAARKARELLSRADRMVGSPRQCDFLFEAGQIGEEAIRLTYYSLPFLANEDVEVLREAAQSLHLLQYHQGLFRSTGSDVVLRQRMTEQTERIERIAAKID